MHLKNSILVLLLLMFVALICCSQNNNKIKNSNAETDHLASNFDPEKAFEKYCSSCHGQQMKMFVDRRWKYGESREEIFASVKHGITASGMPGYAATFTDQELYLLVDYIKTGIKERKSYDIIEEKSPKYYKSKDYTLKIDTVLTDLEIPWGIKVAKDGSIYFTERMGSFKILNPSGELTEIQALPEVRNEVQGGMLDIALHPQFESNGWIYLSYSKFKIEADSKLSTTAVLRGRIEGNKLVDQEEIFVALPYLDSKYHYGSRLIFDKEEYLYITVGDRGRREDHPQFLDNSCGKVHRIFADGSIPKDNPFYQDQTAIKSIWSIGHRNQQGMVYDAVNDHIYTHEHGPRGGDELNLIQKGKNYGWPVISYGINYNGTTFTDLTAKENLEQPLTYWTPSIAPSGMALVSGSNFKKWEGNILSGSLRFNYISRIQTDGSKIIEEERILKDIGRVRAIEMGKDGNIYISIENPGRILKLSIKE